MEQTNSANETDIIVKLNKLTIEKKLEWKIYEGTDVGSRVGESYCANYKDWLIIIFKRRVVDTSRTAKVRPLVIRFRLAIMDVSSKKITMLKETQQALTDLYQTISTQTSRFDEFVNNILKE